MDVIAWPDDDAGRDRIGGKAWALASARTAGLPIPDWFVITSDACPAAESVVAQASTAMAAPTDDIALAIRAAAARLSPDGWPLAIRSSAQAEDAASHSMAGQLESRLFVTPHDICAHVAAVWQSASSSRVLAYTRQLGIARAPIAPAVIVQRMVRTRVSGIAFSADPVSGRRAVCVVTAVRGTGDALAAGEVGGDEWHVHRDGTVVERRIVAETPSLNSTQVLAVAALARSAAAHFGSPQDIEWALDGERLWLLQSRPITSIQGLADPDAAPRLWDNSNIVESYSGVNSPLTFSFASDVYSHVYRQFCRVMCVPASAIAAEDDAFTNMLGLIRGRMYYNLGNWYRVLALLPGFSRNRQFMDQMMGVAAAAQESEVLPMPQPVDAGLRSRLRNAIQIGVMLGALACRHLSISRSIERFNRRLDEALATPATPLSDLRPDELVAHYRDLRQRLLLAWDAPIVNDFFTMIFHGLARRAAERWCGDREGRLLAFLLADSRLPSAEPAARLQKLARLANRNRELAGALESGTVARATTALRLHTAFEAEYRAYLEDFGDRMANELKLEAVTLHEDPRPLMRAIASLARQMRESSAPPAHAPRTSVQSAIGDSLAARPIRRAVFGWLIGHARARVRDREQLRLQRTRLFARVRTIFAELGRRLYDMKVLRDPRDVFMLTTDEILAYVEGRAVSTPLMELASIRRREFETYEREPAPAARFITRGPVYRGNAFEQRRSTSSAAGDRNGLGCSAGVVRGQVRIVRDPSRAEMRPGSILVAEHTDPGWILLFPAAAGVIVERGSLLSHAAIVARELHVPTIVSVPGATRWLKDGDWVEMDGGSGAIRLLALPDAPSLLQEAVSHA